MPYSIPPPRYSSTVSELASCTGVWATHLYARIKRPSVYDATVYGSKSRGGVGRHCPQALGQTVVITSGSETVGEREGSVYAGISLVLTYWCTLFGPQVTLHWARRLHMRRCRLRRPGSVYATPLTFCGPKLNDHSWLQHKCWQPRVHLFTTTLDARYHSLNTAIAADTAASHEVHECV